MPTNNKSAIGYRNAIDFKNMLQMRQVLFIIDGQKYSLRW